MCPCPAAYALKSITGWPSCEGLPMLHRPFLSCLHFVRHATREIVLPVPMQVGFGPHAYIASCPAVPQRAPDEWSIYKSHVFLLPEGTLQRFLHPTSGIIQHVKHECIQTGACEYLNVCRTSSSLQAQAARALR